MGSIVEVGLANAAMVAGLAVVVGGCGLICRKPALVHSLWILVLLKLLTPPLVSVPLPTVSWGAQPQQEVRYVVFETIPEDEFQFEQIDTEASTPEPACFSPTPPPIDWRSIGLSIWALGSVTWLLVTVVRVGRFRAIVREAELAPVELQCLVEDLADRIGLSHYPEVRVVSGAISPMVWAFFGSAKLILPSDLWDRLNDEQRTTLLVHELAHLKRRDHWVRHLELVATAIYWWHPALWWARRSLREAEEECCDAWVVWAMPKSNKTYASALLEAVDFLCEAQCHSLPLGASGAGPVKPLKRRLLMILRGMTPKSLSLTGRLAVLGLASILLPILPGTTSAQQQSADVKTEQVKTFTISNGNTLTITGDDDKNASGTFRIIKPGTAGEEILVIGEDGKVLTESIVGGDGKAINAKFKVGVGGIKIDGLPSGDGKNFTFTTTSDSDDKAADKAELTPEKKEAIEKARKEVAEAQEKLQVALKKLVELEGKNATAQIRMMVVNGDKMVADHLPKAKDMKLDAEKRVQDFKLQIERQAKDMKLDAEKKVQEMHERFGVKANEFKEMSENQAKEARVELRGRIARPAEPADPTRPSRPVPATPLPSRARRNVEVEIDTKTGEQEKRMEAIEKRLEMLLDEIQSMKSKKDAPAEKAPR